AAVARARRLTVATYKGSLEVITENAQKQKDTASYLRSELETCNAHNVIILEKARAVSKGARTQTNLDELNKTYGGLCAHTKTAFELLIDRYAGKYDTADPAKDKEIRRQLKRGLDDIFGINGFNVAAIKKFLGGYESAGGLAILAAAASRSPEAQEELSLVTSAVESFYGLYAVAQTIEFLQVAKENVDLRMLWDSITVFFAETINDHFYEYTPWAYSKGTGYKKLSKEEIYALAAKHHQWLYRYMRNVIVELTDISELPENEQDLLLGNVSEDGVVTDAAGCDYERKPDGSELNEGEGFWRAYDQLREITFIANDGLAAMEIMKENPDLAKKGFEPNPRYPMPAVFDNFDPALIDADNRVNMTFMFPVGRTHQSKLIRSAASCNADRIAKGKPGLNAVITRFAPIQEVGGRKVVVLKDGQFYMSKDEFKNALRVCKGYSKEAADLYIADLERQGSIVDGRIRVAARFSRPIVSTSVVPFHHVPTFDNGALEDAGIPATCQSLYTEWITYDKSCYAEMLAGTGVELPAEMRWLTKWEGQFSNDEEMIKALVEGSASLGKTLTDSNDKPVEFKGLRKFAEEFIAQGIEPIIIVKGAAESGARGQKVFMLSEESLREAAEFILTVSRAPQNMVIQRVIRINPEFWASEELMNEFVDRRIIERSSPVVRTKYPRTPYYCSFRVVPSSPSPDKPYDKTSHIMVMNTEIATNVGRGGSLEPLINEWIAENYQGVIQGILDDHADIFMDAINKSAPQFAERFERKFGRPIGKDILGTPYSWMAFALLDWLAEPVFEKEGKVIDVEPIYKDGVRVGSRIWLEDRNGKRFEGKIKPGKDGWRVYMIEPNTGIGQIDRRTLRMEELEVRRAAQENQPVDWARIESEDRTILNNWADRGVEYGKALFGDDFFRPSPGPNPDAAPVRVGFEDYLRAKDRTPGFQPAGENAEVLKKAYETTRDALSLGEEDAIDNISLSVLLKYCFVESLKQRSGLNVDDVRKKIRSGEWSMADLDAFLAPFVAAFGYSRTVEELLAPMCGKELNMTREELHGTLDTQGYMHRVWGLVRSHLVSEWSCPEVEIMPDAMKGSDVRRMMADKEYLVAHMHSNNAIAANETFALMIDARDTEVGVVGVDASQEIIGGNSSNHILAYVWSTELGRERLISFELTEPLAFDAIWRDETCPDVASELPRVNPKAVSDAAHNKAETLLALTGMGIPRPGLLIVKHDDAFDIIKMRLNQWSEDAMRRSGSDNVEIYVSPNDGTQGIGTKRFTVKKAGVVDEVVRYIKGLGKDAIVREVVGNVVYKAMGSSARTLDMRFNVAYNGTSYQVVSEAMLISDREDAETASVRTGGSFIAPGDVYTNLYYRLERGLGDLVLTNEELMGIRAQVARALSSLNMGRPESERLLFAGVDAKLQVTKDGSVRVVILEVNPQAAGLSHSYSLTHRIGDGNGYAYTYPQVAMSGFWQYLAQRIKAAREYPKTGDVARMMAETLAVLESGEFDAGTYRPQWDVTTVDNQRTFFEILVPCLKARPVSVSRVIANNYLDFLMDKVFPDMQRKTRDDYGNRLDPNRFMSYLNDNLSGREVSVGEPGNALSVIKWAIMARLGELLVKIAKNNVDVNHDLLTVLVPGDNTQSREDAINALDKYVDEQMKKPGTEMAKAQTACAMAADILRRYMGNDEKAKKYDALISVINRDIYIARKMQLLNDIFGGGLRSTPVLVEGGETQEFIGTCPNRKCDSSACGSDALYALHLDPDGGMAVNYPVLFSEERGDGVHMPTALAHRIDDNKIVLRAVTKKGAQEAVITLDNIEELFSVGKNGEAFTDKSDPLHFLKYALFFSGIIHPGVNDLSELGSTGQEMARNNVMLTAQILYDGIRKEGKTGDRPCARFVLANIADFTRGGGIELTCDNHLAPLAAGFSSSSSASISILRALYAMGGQVELLEPQVSADMALVFENDLGRGTGDQDTTGTLKGIHDITYTVRDGKMVREIRDIDVPASVLEELEKRRTVILVPNISRAASAGIGARQKAYLLRDPQAFESIQIAKLQHKQIVEALMKGDFVALGRLEWEYTENRAKIHADAVPDEMRSLFNWLLGKEALVVGGNTVAPQPEKPLILGGELAGSMGTGASASLLASDFGLEAAADGRSTRLESALSLAIEKAPYFSNAYRRYFRLSDKGPEIEIVQRLSTKDETKKPDNNKPAVPDTELEAIIADVAATTGTMSLHLASRYAEAKVLNGFVVVMKENLPESVTGAKGGLIDPILRHEYQRMQQEIGKLFAGSARGLLKANKDNFAKTVSEALGRGLKV
ncbi:MAG: hypothetical protein PHN63_02960, partial [Candidatus Omnitrophica bacterium]|nr:hypothetical protein [Candidatus Omnitrophota bacterium]